MVSDSRHLAHPQSPNVEKKKVRSQISHQKKKKKKSVIQSGNLYKKNIKIYTSILGFLFLLVFGLRFPSIFS